jgi:hypothetical protein
MVIFDHDQSLIAWDAAWLLHESKALRVAHVLFRDTHTRVMAMWAYA